MNMKNKLDKLIKTFNSLKVAMHLILLHYDIVSMLFLQPCNNELSEQITKYFNNFITKKHGNGQDANLFDFPCDKIDDSFINKISSFINKFKKDMGH